MASNLRVDTILPSTGTSLGIGTASGTTTVTNHLNVTGNLGVAGVLTYEDVTNIDSIGIITARAAVSIADSIVHTGDTNTSLRFPSADTITAETGGLERLRIDSSGRVLIGTTNADSIGSIDQNVVIGSTTNAEEVALTLNVMEGTNNRRAKFFLDDDDGVFGIDATASTGVPDFVVRSATSEKFRINSAGLIGVGTATGSSSSTRLVVYEESGNAQTIEIKAKNTGGAGSQPGLRFTAPNNDNIGAVYGDVNSDSLIFATGTVERLKISPDGYVTKPTNPIFNAFGGPSTVGTNTDIVFGQERFDVGGGYNTSTGEYTAPATGYYHFYCQVYRIDTSNDSWWGFYLDTGSGYSQISESRMENDYGGDSGRGYSTLQSSIYWYMTAGHKIKCRVGPTGVIHCNTTLSYFCGNLVG